MHDAQNLADLVRRAGADRPALISDDRIITWGELDAQVDSVARGLLREHSRGDRVAIALPNVPEFVASYFGVLRAGLVAVPVNTGYTARELSHVLTDSGAVALIATDEIAAVAVDLGGPADVYPLGAGLPSGAAADPVADQPVAGPAGGDPVAGPAGGEDLAVLIYTSGTAGTPKGAMLSHRALLANHVQLASIEPPVVGPDDVVLLAVPLFHAYGLNSGLGAVAYHGATGVLIERFDPADTLDLVGRRGVTAIVGVPPMYVAWSLLPSTKDKLAPVRLAVSGAAPLDQAAVARLGRTVFEGYGLTETAPVLTSTVVSPVPKSGSIGRPIPGVELRLVAADGTTIWPSTVDEEESEEADPGEIVVRGPNLFSGYWPDGHDGPDDDGWWATGDIAYADEDGDLFLVDRLGELILVNGFNVYPHEVELVLTLHPAVVAAAAVGIPHPFSGQTVKAYVVKAAAVTADELTRHCERNLARFKCPTAFEFVAELPYSVIGKVRKGALRDE